jgi:hypothetical protein
MTVPLLLSDCVPVGLSRPIVTSSGRVCDLDAEVFDNFDNLSGQQAYKCFANLSGQQAYKCFACRLKKPQ